MKTYSRRSSSYLKKAFIASNFNEMCRLCLSEVDSILTPIIQDSKMSCREWIKYSVDVSVDKDDGLPPNICEECLGMVEQTYLFKKKCKASDSKLREHLCLINSKEYKITDCQFDSINQIYVNNNIKEKMESYSVNPELNLIDPGGLFSSDDNSETKIGAAEKMEDVNIRNPKSKSKGSIEKEIVKSINDENIVISEIKRYVKKNKSTGETNATICEVVHYDIRKEEEEEEDSNDESEIEENFQMKTYSAPNLFEEYGNNSKEAHPKSLIQLDLENDNLNSEKNDKIKSFNPLQADNKNSEGKVQEICQLWDNDDDAEASKEGCFDKLVIDTNWSGNNSQTDNVISEGANSMFKESDIIIDKAVTSQSDVPEPKTALRDDRSVPFKNLNSRDELKTDLLTIRKKESTGSFCGICLKSFTNSNSLKRHKLVHTGAKPFACDICDRKFSQASILKRHRFTHVETKPFECNFCRKSYTQKMNLLTHLRKHGVKTETISHRCKHCDKSFVHPSGLSRHLRLHKGVRFCCAACGKLFTDSSALSRHFKLAHHESLT